jgi:hypothetical protein
MPIQLRVFDETTGDNTTGICTIEVPSERISVRELIRSRVYQEVKDFNVRRPEVYCALVQPDNAERAMNGSQPRKTRSLDWHNQYDTAVEAFEHSQLLVFVDDQQIRGLDEIIELETDSNIRFLKLVPLVGE